MSRPSCKYVRRPDESACKFGIRHLLDDTAIRSKIFDVQVFHDDHDIDIAIFALFAPSPAPLQSNKHESLFELDH